MSIQGFNSLATCNILAESVDKNVVRPIARELTSFFANKVASRTEYFERNKAIFSPKAPNYNLKDQMMGVIACSALMISFGALAVSAL